MDAACELAQLCERELQLLGTRPDRRARGRLGALGEHAERERKRDQPLLRTVVKISLDLPACGVGGLHGSATTAATRCPRNETMVASDPETSISCGTPAWSTQRSLSGSQYAMRSAGTPRTAASPAATSYSPSAKDDRSESSARARFGG